MQIHYPNQERCIPKWFIAQGVSNVDPDGPIVALAIRDDDTELRFGKLCRRTTTFWAFEFELENGKWRIWVAEKATGTFRSHLVTVESCGLLEINYPQNFENIPSSIFTAFGVSNAGDITSVIMRDSQGNETAGTITRQPSSSHSQSWAADFSIGGAINNPYTIEVVNTNGDVESKSNITLP